MPKKTKSKRKPVRSGPKKKRLRIAEDTQSAFDRPVTRNQTAALKQAFDAAHADGMAALKRRDFGQLDEAVRREREIIEHIKPESRKPAK